MSNPMMQAMQQLQEMQARMEQIQTELANRTVTEEAGGGMVRATANGQQQLTRLEIDPEVVNREEKDVLEDLLITAVNKAMASAKTMADREMQNATAGMIPNIPGLNLPF